MNWFSDLPVQRKLGLAMLLTSTIVLVVACGFFLGIEYIGYKRNLIRTASTLAGIAADNATAAIAFGDPLAARHNLGSLRAEPQIVAARIYDANGRLFSLVHLQPRTPLLPTEPAAADGLSITEGQIVVVVPVMEGARRLGSLHLQASMAEIYARMVNYAYVVLGVLASSVCLAWVMAITLRRTLARPMLELAQTAEAISQQQDYSLRARQYGRDELGQLTAAFNAMLERTQAALDDLRESEWSHRELVRALPTAVCMCDVRGRLTVFNDAAVNLWGRTPAIGSDYRLASPVMYRLDGSRLAPEEDPASAVLRTGSAVRDMEFVLERPDGSRRNVLPHPEPVRDTAGKMVGIVNMLVDITEQKRADAAVHRLASIVESSEDAIISKDLNGIITSWNRGAEKLFGYTADAMIGQPITRLIPQQQQNEEPGIIARIKRGEPIEHYETVRRRLDGTLLEVSLTVSPLRGPGGKIVGASKIIRDITERKRVERQTAFLSQLSQELSLLTEPDEILRSAARAVGEELGVSRCQFLAVQTEEAAFTIEHEWTAPGTTPASEFQRFSDFGTPEFWRAMGEGPVAIHDRTTNELTSGPRPSYDAMRVGAHATVPFIREGKWIATLAVGTEGPRVWRPDEIVLLETAVNRTWPLIERARSEKELRESERRQHALLQALPVPCYVVDAKGTLLLFNQAAVSLWGYEPKPGEDCWGEAVALRNFNGTRIAREESPVGIALREKRPVRAVEALVMRSDGTQRWVVPHPDPVFDAEGNCTGVVNVVMDVTEERLAHERVQKVADRLSLAISAASLGDWTWDATSDHIAISPRTSEIYGVPASPSLTRSAMRELLHEEDRARARDALRIALETCSDYDMEYRVVHPDGTLRWVAAKGRCILETNGRPRGMVGVVQDITERKEQAEILQRLARDIETQARLFYATLSNLTDLAYAFDLEGRFIFANRPLLELWGKSLEEIVGKTTFELDYPPDLAARIQAQVQEVIVSKRTVRGENSYTSASGKTDDHEYIYKPVLTDDGTVTAVVGSTRVITERKHAEEILRQSEAQLRLVTDNAPILLVRTDRQHRYTFVNRAYAERIGLKPAAMIGMTVADAVGMAAYQTFKPQMDAALSGVRVEFEMEVPYSRLGRRWIHVIYVPERNAQNEVTGLLGVISDIGARKQAEIELKRARDEAVAASRAKDDFLAALSHELRTPLNPVLLVASDAASNPQLSPSVRADFELIRKNVDLEARLIDDLLDLTRIARGKLHLDQRRCDVHAILQDAVSNVRPDLAGKEITLQTHLEAEPHWVMGDSVRLQQVFWNVLKNAVKFTPAQGRITLASRVEQDQVIIEIKDSGIGMTEEEIGRAFDAFSQGDHAINGSYSHRFGGLGLGLAITKMLVDLHAGRIEAASEGRNRGSTFVITLPLCAPGSAGTSAPMAQPGAVPPAPMRPERAPLRILLVEDHTPTRLTLQHLLRRRNFEVVAADSAEKARELALQGEIDLVISDVGLPDRNGYDLMAELRARHPTLIGIALSGYGMEEDLTRSRAAGFAAHLVKPVTIDALDDSIARVLATSSVS